jgi:DNA replication and repair protein RecF
VQLVEHGLSIISARQKVVGEINERLLKEEAFTEGRLKLRLNITAPPDRSKWLDALACHGSGKGILRLGPHCDRLRIHLNNREIRCAGSRGQQKLAGVAIRLAESAVRVQHRGLIPVLLLDDCMEALDPDRQYRLLNRLAASGAQLLMTAPTGMRIPQGVEADLHDIDRLKQAGIAGTSRTMSIDMGEAA